MNLKRIEQIESRVSQSTSLSAEDKAALLQDLATLKAEAAAFPQPEGNEPALAPEEPLAPAVRELTSSVQGLEASHPRATELVNRIAVVLSNMGI